MNSGSRRTRTRTRTRKIRELENRVQPPLYELNRVQGRMKPKNSRKQHHNNPSLNIVPEDVESRVPYVWSTRKRRFVRGSPKYHYAANIRNWLQRDAVMKELLQLKSGTRRINNKQSRKPRQKGGAQGLADFLPTTQWSNWTGNEGSLAVDARGTQVPPPLANGGLFTGAQSTGQWASQPLPPTQWAHSLESARISGNPEVFLHQRPNDNMGASFSPAWK